jgi:hypothetical protein
MAARNDARKVGSSSPSAPRGGAESTDNQTESMPSGSSARSEPVRVSGERTESWLIVIASRGGPGRSRSAWQA